MLEKLVGNWKYRGEYDGTQTETKIAIDAQGCVVARMHYPMPNARQIVEHYGTVHVETDWFRVNLEKGYTKEFQGGDSEEGPLREFTKCEMNETQEMLSQKIAFQITPEGTLRTEITAPVEMVIIYDRC